MAICGISKRVLLSYLVPKISQVVPSSAVCCRSLNSKCDLLMPFKSGWFQRSRYVHSSRMLFCVASQPIATVRLVGNKISRAAMAEARAVLFDYLQNTRSFQFADADYMSRNSDCFLLDLLSKVDIKENVTKSLWRYLHFHPINEFEPFFESLGMTPNEYSAYLPRDLMFLSDNQVLLDNFHDLCNYGIPRGKMGKIYAEAESIFRYDHGVLASKFRAYEEFGLNKSSLIKFFIFDPSLLAGDANTEFIDFLQRLNKIGLENDWLAGYVSAESSYNWARMSQTVEILDRLGYGGDNVAKLFRNEPGLLLDNSGKAIQILIIQLTKLGFKKDDVVTLFLQDPKLMSKKRLKNLSHSMTFLFEIGMKLEDIAYVVQTHKHILSSDTPKRPRTVLGTLKVGESALREMIKKEPTILFVSSSILLDNFHDLCNYGIPHGKMGKIYAEAESIFRYDYGVLASKFRAYEEFGLSKSSLIKFFTCDPSLLAGDVNTKFIDFLQRLNKIGLENDWLAGYVSAESTYNWTTMSQTVEILDRLGYGGDNVAKLFRNEPGLLLENSGKVIQILIRQLTKLGFKKDDVVTLFLQDPKLMSKKRLKNLSHSMTFLFEIRMKLEDIAYVVRTHKHILSSKTPKRPRTVLVYLKVGESALREMIKKEPTILFVSSSTSCPEDYKAFSYSLQAPARYLEKATFLKWLGYIENSEEFVEAAKRFRGRGDQLQERFNCLVQAGLDSYTVADIIKRVPRILKQRKEVLEQKIHLLTNVIGYPLECLVSCPDYLCYDVKRISLRFSMYSWMRDRGVAKPAMSLSTILCCSEERFVKYFVDIHDHGQAVWEKLKESSQTAQTKR
ncbi:hypothetical protein QQ045_017748 [Rhodiola kirilowii]